MNGIKFAFNLYRITFRVMFGPKHPFQKEYDEALDTLEERGHWLHLYDSLEGPNGAQVLEALKKWVDAHQAKKEYTRSMCSLTEEQDVLVSEDWNQDTWDQLHSTEKNLGGQLRRLIYGNKYSSKEE